MPLTNVARIVIENFGEIVFFANVILLKSLGVGDARSPGESYAGDEEKESKHADRGWISKGLVPQVVRSSESRVDAGGRVGDAVVVVLR